MAKRDWNALQWIAYYYIAFAIFTDREYSDSEKEMIGAKLLRFTGGDETKLGYCINTLTECQKWIGEDIKNSTSDNDIVNNNLGKISAFLKDKLEDRHHKYIILDLIAIAKADGKFTDKEKGWIELVGNQLGINTEDIISKAMREMENTNDSPVLEKQQETKTEAIEEKIEQFSGPKKVHKMRFPMRFMHFFGPGTLFVFFLQRVIHINASRASWELIFDALKSCDRWLFNAYRFVFQLVIFGRNGIKRIGAFFGTKYFGKKLQKRVPKMDVLGPKNVAIIYYRHKR